VWLGLKTTLSAKSVQCRGTKAIGKIEKGKKKGNVRGGGGGGGGGRGGGGEGGGGGGGGVVKCRPKVQTPYDRSEKMERGSPRHF